MTFETINANGVHIAGNFQQAAGFPSDWDPATTQLIDSAANGIYEITVSLPAGTYEYKYVNGNAWGSDETVPSACGVGAGVLNRQVIVGSNDTVIPAVYYGTCTLSQPPNNVVFQVDMSNQTVDSTGVYLAGNFQVLAGFPSNWDPTTIQLTDPDNDSIYTDTIAIPSGTIEYKFLNGNSFNGEETVPSSCGVSNGLGGFNRSLTFSSDTALPVVCFNSCQSCAVPPPPSQNVTFKVDMSTYSGSYSHVFVSGTFNGWSGSLDTLTDLDGDTVFEKTITMPAGTYEFKFQLDNWTVSEQFTGNEPCVIQSGSVINRVFSLISDTTLGTYCFNSCAACPAAPPTFYEVVFSVDMKDFDTTYSNVYVSGTFNSWCGTCDELTDPDLDGIYTDTLLLPADTFLFKYSIDNWTFSEQFTGTESCTDTAGGVANRTLAITGDTTLNTVCYNSCASCPPRASYQVTFITDLSFYPVDSNGVFLYSSVNGFTSPGSQLSSIGDSLYATTLTLDSGKTYYYKYFNGDTSEQTFGACFLPAPNGQVLRSYTATTANDTLLSCFNECDTCAAIPAVQYFQVTLRVGMFGQTIDPNGVHVAGNFQQAAGFANNWDPSATQLTDIDGDSIYEVTVSIPADTFEYKFINGNTWTNDEVVPAACGVGSGSLNREMVITGDTVLPAFCFSACSPCSQSIPATQFTTTFRVDMRLQTIDPSGVYLTGDFAGWSADSLPMTNQGNDVFTLTLPLDSGVTYQYKFLNGNSFTGEETVPQACGVPNGLGGFNREVTPITTTVLDTVCFNDCVGCNLTTTKQVSVTFRVDMTNETVNPSGVFLSGSFNNWGFTPMANIGGELYEASLQLDSTAQYQYKFVNGNAPGTYETVPPACGVSDGFGGFNRSVIAFGSITLGAVCFAECAACSTPPTFLDVTFSVDMKNETVSPEGVHVAGSFNNYNPKTHQLTDPDGDTIYEAVISIEEGSSILYNYYNGNTLADIEVTDSLLACGIQNSNGVYERSLMVSVGNLTPKTTCFSRCSNCVEQNDDIGLEERTPTVIKISLIGDLIRIQNSTNQKIANVELWDLTGKMVFSHSPATSSGIYSLNLTHPLSQGVYVVQVTTDVGVYQQKLYYSPHGRY